MSGFVPPQGLDKPWYGILPPQGAKAVAPQIPVIPPPLPPPPLPLNRTTNGKIRLDDFNDNAIDALLWATGSNGPTHGSSSLSETNQQIEIYMATSSEGTFAERYLVSVFPFSFANGYVVEVDITIPDCQSESQYREADIYLCATYTTSGKLWDQLNWLRFIIDHDPNEATYWYVLGKKIGGSYTAIKSSGGQSDRTLVVRIIIDGTNVKVYLDNVLWQDTVAHGLNFTNPYHYFNHATSKNTLRTSIHDNWKIYKSETITCNNLPDGYKIRIRKAGPITVATSSGASGGSASISLSALSDRPPYYDIQVLDASDNVLTTGSEFLNDVWGGDVYYYGALTKMTIIKDVTVSGAAVSSIDLTGLDIGTHIQYLLLAKILNAYAGSNYLDLYVNGDTTRTNYYSQYLDQDGATRTKARENNPIIGKLDTSTEAFIVASIMVDPTGYPRILAKSNWKRGNTLMRSDRTVIKTATVANITQLTLTAQQANSIEIGSRVILLGYGTT